jgi:hypothetical protein
MAVNAINNVNQITPQMLQSIGYKSLDIKALLAMPAAEQSSLINRVNSELQAEQAKSLHAEKNSSDVQVDSQSFDMSLPKNGKSTADSTSETNIFMISTTPTTTASTQPTTNTETSPQTAQQPTQGGNFFLASSSSTQAPAQADDSKRIKPFGSLSSS